MFAFAIDAMEAMLHGIATTFALLLAGITFHFIFAAYLQNPL